MHDYQIFSRSSFLYKWSRVTYNVFKPLPLSISGSFVKNLDTQAIGNRKTKYITLNKILELIHPKPNASLSQAHSIHFAASGITIEIAPMQKAILPSKGALKKYESVIRPITMTSMVLNLSLFCTVQF